MSKDNKFSDRNFISDIEKLIGRPLDSIVTVKWNSFGFEVKNSDITGIGLYKTGITELPDSFWGIHSMVRLSLVDTRLQLLSPLVRNFTGLQELYIGGNGFETVPEQIGELTELKFLYIIEDDLLSLPQEIGSLINLEELSIISKKIKTISESILSLNKHNCRIYLNNQKL